MKKVIAKNVGSSSSEYIGSAGELFYDILGPVRMSDGTTPGGIPLVGADGKSAYQIAVEEGFVGTEEAWLESLEGPPGPPTFFTANYIQASAPTAGLVIGARWYNTTTNTASILTNLAPDVWTPEINFSYNTIEDSFTSTVVQHPSALDTPTVVTYGAAKTTPNGLASIDANGILTILKTGPYQIKTRHRVGRTGSIGASDIFQWVEISVNGGSTWTITGNPVSTRLSTSDDVMIFFDTTSAFFPAGVKLRAMYARCSSGNNSGGLYPEVPSAALQSYGLTPAPSAQLSIYRTQNWNYV